MAKRMVIMILVLLVVFGGIFGFKWYVGKQIAKHMQAYRPPPVSVSSATASNEVWHPTLQAVGTLRAVQGISVSPEVAGVVREIHFESGQQVNQGDLLVQLDIAVEQAQLKGFQAQEKLAELSLKRVQNLAKTQVSAQAELDQATANYQQAQANVESTQAAIDKKTIRAPFSGLAGIREIALGQYLAAGDNIVTLQSLDPIYANFSLPQQDFSLVRVGQPVTVQVDAFPNKPFPGTITAINSKVTATTRTFDIQATLTNSDFKLRPGMFGEVSVQLPEERNVVTLPKTAISYNPYGDSVFIIGAPESSTNGAIRPHRQTGFCPDRRGARNSSGDYQRGESRRAGGDFRANETSARFCCPNRQRVRSTQSVLC